jgi:hypothetical protein
LKKGAIVLLSWLLGACAQASLDEVTAAQSVADERQNAYRAVIYFSGIQGTDRTRIGEAISGACKCEPEYLRPYGLDALIYKVVLPPGYGFPVFQRELMRSSDELGILSVEPDHQMQPQ